VPTTNYFGLNVDPGGAVVGNPATARAAFDLAVESSTRETFADKAMGDHLTLSLLDGAATLTADYTYPVEERLPIEIVDAVTDPAANGRFGTSGTTPERWALTSVSVEIEFATARNGVGLYLTDIGDFLSIMEVEFVKSDDTTVAISLNSLDPGVGAPNSGWLVFVGILSDDTTYKAVRFNIEQSNPDPNEWDFVGIDDVVIGTFAVPAPAVVLQVSRGWGATHNIVTFAMTQAPP
jgi:hypothetical protein